MMRHRIIWALIAMAFSGTCTACGVFILAFLLFGDIDVGRGTALTYLLPGTSQSALCLLSYHLLSRRSRQNGLADPSRR